MNLINTDFICEGRRFRRLTKKKRKIYRDPRSDFASIKSSLKVTWIFFFEEMLNALLNVTSHWNGGTRSHGTHRVEKVIT